VARDGEDARAVGHDDVLTLASDPKAGFLERANGIKMVDACELRHVRSNRHDDFADIFACEALFNDGEILRDRILDVLERLGLCFTLRPAAGQART